jgi:hypothetical protein
MVSASVTLLFGAMLGFVALSTRAFHVSWLVWLAVLVAFAGTEWFFWRVIKPPFLKADATEISCVAPLARQRMPRSEVAFIFRANVLRHDRNTYWDKGYIFASSNGKVGVSCSASGFTDEAMTEFAQRLQVPIRGDFSMQVKDRWTGHPDDLPPMT